MSRGPEASGTASMLRAATHGAVGADVVDPVAAAGGVLVPPSAAVSAAGATMQQGQGRAGEVVSRPAGVEGAGGGDEMEVDEPENLQRHQQHDQHLAQAAGDTEAGGASADGVVAGAGHGQGPVSTGAVGVVVEEADDDEWKDLEDLTSLDTL